jgi:FdhD protein
VTAGGLQRTVAITMRTPGADFELAAGFLLGEGVISERNEIERINYCVRADIDIEQRYNIVTVALRRPTLPDLASLDRHFVTSSACGVCGKASLDALELRSCAVLPAEPQINSELLFALPDLLRTNQTLFAATGGLHGAALFDRNGALLAVREDVGRHNAVDKLIGWALMQDLLPLNQHILLVSGRTSFEIMQKALAAGLPIVCGVSAPSSLAVALAQRFNMTLVGFLRGERYNVYAGAARLID